VKRLCRKESKLRLAGKRESRNRFSVGTDDVYTVRSVSSLSVSIVLAKRKYNGMRRQCPEWGRRREWGCRLGVGNEMGSERS